MFELITVPDVSASERIAAGVRFRRAALGAVLALLIVAAPAEAVTRASSPGPQPAPATAPAPSPDPSPQAPSPTHSSSGPGSTSTHSQASPPSPATTAPAPGVVHATSPPAAVTSRSPAQVRTTPRTTHRSGRAHRRHRRALPHHPASRVRGAHPAGSRQAVPRHVAGPAPVRRGGLTLALGSLLLFVLAGTSLVLLRRITRLHREMTMGTAG
jgi:hypothetical protein